MYSFNNDCISSYIKIHFLIFEILKPKKINLCVQILGSRVPVVKVYFKQDPLIFSSALMLFEDTGFDIYRLLSKADRIKLYTISR